MKGYIEKARSVEQSPSVIFIGLGRPFSTGVNLDARQSQEPSFHRQRRVDVVGVAETFALVCACVQYRRLPDVICQHALLDTYRK
jgi:hypothetical protein